MKDVLCQKLVFESKIIMKIKIMLVEGKLFVWNAQDVFELRTEHHIVGSLTGCFPYQTFQNSYNWLPLQLLPEEGKILCENGIAELASSSFELTPDQARIFWTKQMEINTEQCKKLEEIRLKTAEENGCLKRELHQQENSRKRRKKLNNVIQQSDPEVNQEANDSLTVVCSTLSKPTINDSSMGSGSNLQNTANIDYKEDIQKKNDTTVCPDNNDCIEICPHNAPEDKQSNKMELLVCEPLHNFDVEDAKNGADQKDLDVLQKNMSLRGILQKGKAEIGVMHQLFTENLWRNSKSINLNDLNFPGTNHERIRYAVYKDLWGRGYYLTVANKFGGDYLAYAGDPMKYHALFIVICLEAEQNFCADDLIIYGRLGNQVKKNVVLASVNSDENVEYLTLYWEINFSGI